MEYEHDPKHPPSAPKRRSLHGKPDTRQPAEDRGLTPAEEAQQRATRLYHMRHMLHEARQRAAARAAAKAGAAPDSAATEQAAREQAETGATGTAAPSVFLPPPQPEAAPSADLLRQFNAAQRDVAEGHGTRTGAAPAGPAAALSSQHAPSPREERPVAGEQVVAAAAREERERAVAPPAPDGVHGADMRAAAPTLQPAPHRAATPSGLAPLVIPSTSRQIEALRARGAGVPLDPALARMMAGGWAWTRRTSRPSACITTPAPGRWPPASASRSTPRATTCSSRRAPTSRAGPRDATCWAGNWRVPPP